MTETELYEALSFGTEDLSKPTKHAQTDVTPHAVQHQSGATLSHFRDFIKRLVKSSACATAHPDVTDLK